ncbi:MAG: hypothetical protein RLZZ612_566 [Pseudomonadota bacterium]
MSFQVESRSHRQPLMRPSWRWAALTVGAMLLTACAHTPPPPQPDLSLPAPAAWTLAPLPHEAAAAPDRHWWSRWEDAVLLHLQAQAVRVSPTLAAAATRMARARHEWTMADAAAGPTVQGVAAWQRGVAQPGLPASTTVSAGVQASWEIDLWGGLAAQQQGARERAHASAALSGAARVGLEAEVARQYTGWRICQQFTALSQTDAQSRATTARLTALQVQAGLAPATASALTEASAAQGRMQVTQQQARCDAALRGLSELTGLDVAALQAQLKTDPTAAWDAARVPALQIPNALPATLLAQRPDVWAAQRAVLAASADVQATDADQRPRLSLSGQLMPVRSIGVGADATVWSIGPVQLSVPLWDGGRRQSASAVSRVAYDEALSSYRASVRTAVREVESALIELHSIRQRETDAATATERLTQVLKATTERQRAGLASVLELEDVRRTALNAQLSLIELARDRAWAWIDLYRVLGGGWEASNVSSITN